MRLIDGDALIEAHYDYCNKHHDETAVFYGWSMRLMKEAPSAQPELLDEWCTDCKEYDHERNCCPRWNRVIRQTLKDAQPEIILCKDCKWKQGSECVRFAEVRPFPDDFCSRAERRTDVDVES